MALVPLGAQGTANKEDVLEGETFSSNEEGLDVEGTIPNHGSRTITGPNDTLNGSGYYTNISNNITDRGTDSISSPGSDLPSGYYNGINNNITDRGSISDLGPGDSGESGYYSSGTVEDSSITENLTEVDSDSDTNTSGNGGISMEVSHSSLGIQEYVIEYYYEKLDGNGWAYFSLEAEMEINEWSSSEVLLDEEVGSDDNVTAGDSFDRTIRLMSEGIVVDYVEDGNSFGGEFTGDITLYTVSRECS